MAEKDSTAEVLALLATLADELADIQQDAALEQALAADTGAWFALRARLQSAEGLVDAIGSALAAPDSETP